MANVKVFADRQTDRQTDGQAKNYMPPIFRYGGIKSRSGLLIIAYKYWKSRSGLVIIVYSTEKVDQA